MTYRWVGLTEFMSLSPAEQAQVAVDLCMDDGKAWWRRNNRDLDDAEEHVGDKQEAEVR